MSAPHNELVRLWLAAACATLLPFSVNLRSKSRHVAAITLPAGTAGAYPMLTDRLFLAVWILAVTATCAGLIYVSFAHPPASNRPVFRKTPFLLPAVFIIIGLAAAALEGRGAAASTLERILRDDSLWVTWLAFSVAIFLVDDVVVALVQQVTHRAPTLTTALPSSTSNPLIGWFERALVFLFVFTGNPDAAALAFTAKSLARIPQVAQARDDAFAEYVLIGTLVSVSAGAAVAVLARVSLGMSAL